MIAFDKYKEIEVLADVIDKHRHWLEDYEGITFSVAVDGKHLMKWMSEPEEYTKKKYETKINCIGRLKNRTVIEFDGNEELAKEHLETTAKKLKEMNIGFIRSSHKGKSDYLWIEFSRNVTDTEVKRFLYWIAPKGSEIDLNFAYSKKVFPVLFAVHWKHSYQREMPVEFYEGNQVDYDTLGIKTEPIKSEIIKTPDGFKYEKAIKQYSPEEIEKGKVKVKESYYKIIELAKEYIEMPERYYHLLAVWIIGTYVHKRFNTFPFLFINAMRGSGKTRLLKFIARLAWNGDIVADIKEAVLFRTAAEHTLLIDEFEHIGGKDKGVLRELLNAGYKKGIKVKRMHKVYRDKEERQEVEEFEIYTPIVMANIWGMDEVLNDRCITIILEKSNNSIITKMAEDFDSNVRFNELTRDLVSFSVMSLCENNIYNNILTDWNNYLKSTILSHTITTPNDTTTLTTHNNTKQHLFKKIDEIGIDGRNLELFFSLYIIASGLGEEILEKILLISKDVIGEKKEDEFNESKDVALIDFVSHQIQWQMDYISLRAIKDEFRQFLGEQEHEDNWLNERWVGKALKRLCLIGSKRRKSKGAEYILNIAKAKEKIKMFKGKDDEEEPKTPN